MKNTLFALLACTAAFSLQPALAQDGQALFNSKPCVGCHMVGSKLVGPALKVVAAYTNWDWFKVNTACFFYRFFKFCSQQTC